MSVAAVELQLIAWGAEIWKLIAAVRVVYLAWLVMSTFNYKRARALDEAPILSCNDGGDHYFHREIELVIDLRWIGYLARTHLRMHFKFIRI
jgi:hypothetical protein